MNVLFNSNGQHIANWLDGQLYAPAGQHIGHYMEDHQIFVDMTGHYMGEIVFENRLMCKLSSPYHNQRYNAGGNYDHQKSAGNYGDPGSKGDFGKIEGYENLETTWL